MNTDKWLSDPSHSELNFRIRHLMISNVSGTFKDFRVTATTEGDDFTKANITLTADISSIDTGNPQRDEHLRGADFFDTAQYPSLTFVSTRVEKQSGDTFTLHGDLTMKGITSQVSVDVTFGGFISDERHGTKAGFTITGKLNRSDWGISFNRILDTGGLGLGEEVKVFSELQLVKQPQ